MFGNSNKLRFLQSTKKSFKLLLRCEKGTKTQLNIIMLREKKFRRNFMSVPEKRNGFEVETLFIPQTDGNVKIVAIEA